MRQNTTKAAVSIILISLLGVLLFGIDKSVSYYKTIQQVLKIFSVLLFCGFTIKYFSVILTNNAMRWLLLFLFFSSLYLPFSPYSLQALPFLYVQLSGLFFYVVGRKNYISDRALTIFTCLLFIICSYNTYFSLSSSILKYDSLENLGGDNTGYLIVLILPFLFLIIKNRASLLMLLLTIVFVFLSRKRGAILALMIPSVIFLFSYYKYSIKKTSLLLAIYGVAFIGGLYYFINNYSNIFLSRFDGMQNTSGRSTLYSIIYDDWLYNSNFFETFFGRGFYATFDITQKKLGYSLYAHSDIYEILYDFGLMGLTSYAILVLLLLYQTFKTMKKDKIIFSALLSALAIFILKAAISGVFFDFDCFILMGAIGYLLGRYDFNLRNNVYLLKSNY